MLTAAEPGTVAVVQAARLAHPGRDLVASHLTAARLHKLPKPLTGWGPPTFTSNRRPVVVRPDLHIHVAELPDGAVIGSTVRLTGTARTVVDCLRSLEPRDGLAIADAALHRGLVTRQQLLGVAATQRRWPGVARARLLLQLADGRRESPFESWSAWAFEQVGVPGPEWQVVVRDPDGRFIGRGDAWWAGVIGEADGKSKYRLAAAERGGANPDSLFKVLDSERRRERNMRDVGIDVVRWGAVDVLDLVRAEALGRRIEVACRRAAEMGPYIAVVSLR
ncbi:hypothetical protein ACIB24_13235 [Spongisporangium articulatum]|uniref:Uncharacterized protein n=1 Tax=Spongisporangium articulatum TaxID=3362603 RepID=A0ABW8ANS2_9ACTN